MLGCLDVVAFRASVAATALCSGAGGAAAAADFAGAFAAVAEREAGDGEDSPGDQHRDVRRVDADGLWIDDICFWNGRCRRRGAGCGPDGDRSGRALRRTAIEEVGAAGRWHFSLESNRAGQRADGLCDLASV